MAEQRELIKKLKVKISINLKWDAKPWNMNKKRSILPLTN